MNKRLRKKLDGRVGGHHSGWFARRVRRDLNAYPPGIGEFYNLDSDNYNELLCYAVYKREGTRVADELADWLGG